MFATHQIKLIGHLAALCLLVATGNVFAQPPAADLDVESLLLRLEATEQRLQDLESRQIQSEDERVQPAGLRLYDDEDADIASFGDRAEKLEESWKSFLDTQKKDVRNPSLQINGRIHLDSWSFPKSSDGINFFEHPTNGTDPENRLLFRRIRLSFRGDIFENMEYRMQTEFHAPDTGEMKDVYIGFKHLPIFQTVRIGNQKRPLGLDHLNSSNQNIFLERPLVVEAFNEDARRVGIASYGISDDEQYNWRFGAFAMENLVTDGEIIGDSSQFSFNGRLASTPWYDESSDGRGYLHLAIAGMVARPDGDRSQFDTNNNEGRFRTRSELRSDQRWLNTNRIAGASWYEIMGLETIFNAGPFQVVGEYQNSWMQRENTAPGTGPDLFFHGAYVYVAYMLTGEHVPYSRKTGIIGRVKPFENFFLVDRCTGGVGRGWGAWQLALRYSYLDLTDEDIRGGVEHDVTAGLVWYMTSHSSLQMNAIYGDIRDHAPVGGFTSGHFTSLGTRLRIEF